MRLRRIWRAGRPDSGWTRDQVSDLVFYVALGVILVGSVLFVSQLRSARDAAERKAEETKGTDHLRERHFMRVRRSFTLPTQVEDAKVTARLDRLSLANDG